MEAAANDYIRRIDEMGGMIPAIEAGFPQREIADASYRVPAARWNRGERKIVGVNAFQAERRASPSNCCRSTKARPSASRAKLEDLRAARDNARVPRALDALRRAAEGPRTPCRFILDAVRAYATVGEICEALQRRIRNIPGKEYPVGEASAMLPVLRWTRIRVLVAKPGLDGHDRGAKVIARALRDAGMEVIYTGLRQTPEMIVNAALQEDVQVIGLSILSGAHNAIVPRVMELLREKQMTDVLVIVGGIVPDEDAAEVEEAGRGGGVSARLFARSNCRIHPVAR